MRVVRAPLGELADAAAAAGIRPPALTVVGAVASLALAPPALGPLAGVTVTVTRAQPQAAELASRLRRLGAAVVEAPTIRIEKLPAAPLDPRPYDLICLTSPNGVEPFFERLAAASLDARSLAGKTVAAIGPGTAKALAGRGVVADLVGERFVAEGLLEALDKAAGRIAGRRALVARAQEARDVLPKGLQERGYAVDVLPLYRTKSEPLPPPLLAKALAADYITFTAASTVRSFLSALPEGGKGLREQSAAKVVSIGPQTSAALREGGVEPDREADRHDLEGLIAAILADHGG